MNTRRVGYGILLKLLKTNWPLSFVGFVFLVISICALLPFTITTSQVLGKPYEKYNFDKIEKNGLVKTATITAVNPITNVTINGDHPKLISYEFDDNGKPARDKFETLDLDKTDDYKTGTSIQILAYQGETMIKGLKPFTFPVYVFFFLPLAFFIIGIIFFLPGLVPALRIFKLYKTGTVRDAWVISMEIKTRTYKANVKQFVLVHYYYLDAFKSKILGETLTNDMLMLNQYKSGDVVKIFVSDENEKNSCLVPKLDAIKNNWDVKF